MDNGNFRSLAPVRDPEVVETKTQKLHGKLAQIQREMDGFHKMIGMFNSAGWRAALAILQRDQQVAQEAILKTGVGELGIDDVKFVRGQASMLQNLFDLEPKIRRLMDQRRKEYERTARELEQLNSN